MKPIHDGNLSIEVEMNETGLGDLNVFVKTKLTLQKMKPIQD